MHPHGLRSHGVQLVPVELSRPRLVLLLGVVGHAVVGPEECRGIGVSAELHLSALLPCPVGVQLCGPDKRQVDAKGTVDPGAVDANEDAVRDRGPRRVLRATIKANLEMNE